MKQTVRSTAMSDNITQEPPSEQAAEPDDPWSEFVVRQIPLFALLLVLGNFAIVFGVFRLGLE
jgi:hypothetical protein